MIMVKRNLKEKCVFHQLKTTQIKVKKIYTHHNNHVRIFNECQTVVEYDGVGYSPHSKEHQWKYTQIMRINHTSSSFREKSENFQQMLKSFWQLPIAAADGNHVLRVKTGDVFLQLLFNLFDFFPGNPHLKFFKIPNTKKTNL